MLLQASSIFGHWKRHPYLFPLLTLYKNLVKRTDIHFEKNKIIEKLKKSKLEFFERGDYFHFIGDSVYSVSYPLTYFWFQIIKKKQITRGFIRFCQCGDEIVNFLFKKKIKKNLYQAKGYYEQGLVCDDEDDEYYYLILCRLIEVNILLGEIETARKIYPKINEAKDYYHRESISHGIGNTLIAIIYYKYYVEKENDIFYLLNDALEKYGNHEAGILKTYNLAIRSNTII